MAQGVGPKVKECLDHMLRLFSLTEREREIGLGHLLLFSFLLYV